MERLKQRREERKKKADDDKQTKNDPSDNNEKGKQADVQFEKMIKKKKATIENNPKAVMILYDKS